MSHYDSQNDWDGTKRPVTGRTVQQVNDKSCQPCGCDEGANHLCAQHYVPREEHMNDAAAAWMTHELCKLDVMYRDEEADVNDAKVISFEDSEYPDVAYYRKMHGPVGIGGAPTRATTLPTAASERKQFPIATGFLDYFPDAIVAIANLSFVGNEQHNPGLPLHWDRTKSADEADTMLRHFMERGTRDKDGVRHTVKAAWRLLAYLQKELEQESK